MRGIVACGLVLASFLAGCTGGGPSAAEEDPFAGVQLQVSSTTGGIRGIVVDERITPISGATIDLTGANVAQTAKSDEEGRFSFSNLAPGTYFLAVSSTLHLPAQTSVDVVAGEAEPPITKVLLNRLFSQQPFSEQTKVDGFIQCNQAGVYYGSAPCVTDFTGVVGGDLEGTVPGCTPAGCAPQLRRVLTEQRGFRTAVGPGWQRIILEMSWQETSETFDRMGITFSYNETQRPASHWYARSDSTSPLRMEIKTGEVDETHQDEPEMIPPEGHPDLYYFVGVRQSAFPVPNVAVNQQFQLFQTNFYYGLPPEGWAIVNGDALPF
jgi:hypothetical protein